MPKSEEKTGFQGRLDIVIIKIKNTAINSVTKAEKTQIKAYVSTAQKAINNITDLSTEKALQKKLNVVIIKIKNTAINSGTKAEKTQTKACVSTAQKAINNITDSSTKKALLLLI